LRRDVIVSKETSPIGYPPVGMKKELSFGRSLRLARIAGGLRQIDLASLSGLSTSTISLIENDLRLPSREQIDRLRKHIGIYSDDVEAGP
jgi:DNA-binding XRE family transcriptional regulator